MVARLLELALWGWTDWNAQKTRLNIVLLLEPEYAIFILMEGLAGDLKENLHESIVHHTEHYLPYFPVRLWKHKG